MPANKPAYAIDVANLARLIEAVNRGVDRGSLSSQAQKLHANDACAVRGHGRRPDAGNTGIPRTHIDVGDVELYSRRSILLGTWRRCG